MNIQAQQAVVASGGDATGKTGSAAYSFGQLIYTDGDSQIKEGVQHAYEIYSLGTEDRKNQFGITVYSNPISEDLKFKIERLEDGMQYQLIDIQGTVLENKKISGSENSVQMNNLARGTYFLKITNSNIALKTLKIIKN